MFIRNCIFAITLIACAIFSAQQPARAQVPPYPPSATIQFTVVKGSYFLGITGGSGALYFQGRSYPIGIGGLSFGLSIGGSTADLIGEVYNIASPYDIEGVYGAAKASYAVAGGDAAIVLRNTRGVEIHLRGKQIGLEISADLSGLAISLQ